MKQLLDQGDKKDFDEFMEAGLKDEPNLLAMLRWRMAPYGTDSFYDAYVAAEAQHLDADTLAKITTPLLITSPDHEQFWPGQSDELHAAVPSSTLMQLHRSGRRRLALRARRPRPPRRAGLQLARGRPARLKCRRR